MKHNTLFHNQSCKWQFILKCRREIKISLNKSFGQQRKHFQNILHESFCWWYLPIHIWVPVLVYIFYHPLSHTFCSFCTSFWVRFYILDDKMFCTFSYIRRSKRSYRIDIYKMELFFIYYYATSIFEGYLFLPHMGWIRTLYHNLACNPYWCIQFCTPVIKYLYDIICRVYFVKIKINS